jgi:hypothetical protein
MRYEPASRRLGTRHEPQGKGMRYKPASRRVGTRHEPASRRLGTSHEEKGTSSKSNALNKIKQGANLDKAKLLPVLI